MPIDSLANSASMMAERARFEKMVRDNKLTHDVHSTEYDVAVLIGIYGRHDVVKLNVDMLCNQSLKPAIILVASFMNDIDYIKTTFKNYDNVFLCLSPNYPLGLKWSDGAKYCQRFQVNGLAITGSDDCLSLEYLEYCYQIIGQGEGSNMTGCVDLVGPRTWYVYNTQNTLVFPDQTTWETNGEMKRMDDLYKFTQNPNQPIILGAGRMYSKRILEVLGWEVFDRTWAKHLDNKGYLDTLANGGKVYQITTEPDIAVVSIKGDWDTMNPFDKLLHSNNMVNEKLDDEMKEKFFNTYFNAPSSLFRITR